MRKGSLLWEHACLLLHHQCGSREVRDYNHAAKTPSLCFPTGSQEEYVDCTEFVSIHLEGKEAILVLFLNNRIYVSMISNSVP